MCVSVLNRKLTKVLRNYVDNAEKPGISDQLYKAMKALEYIFKFIVRSRILFNQYVSPCRLSRGLGGDPFLPAFLPSCLCLLPSPASFFFAFLSSSPSFPCGLAETAVNRQQFWAGVVRSHPNCSPVE